MLEKSRLLRPINFLKIKTYDIWWYKFWYPLFFTILFYSYIIIFNMYSCKSINLFGDNSLVSYFLSIIQILTGFYIAALAAVATFGKGNLDETIKNGGATLTSSQNGKTKPRELTRRHFLSYLFGYLAFISICLSFAIIVFQVCNPAYLFCGMARCAILYFSFFIFLFFFGQAIILTMLGIFFLCDRINWQES